MELINWILHKNCHEPGIDFQLDKANQRNQKTIVNYKNFIRSWLAALFLHSCALWLTFFQNQSTPEKNLPKETMKVELISPKDLKNRMNLWKHALNSDKLTAAEKRRVEQIIQNNSSSPWMNKNWSNWGLTQTNTIENSVAYWLNKTDFNPAQKREIAHAVSWFTENQFEKTNALIQKYWHKLYEKWKIDHKHLMTILKNTKEIWDLFFDSDNKNLLKIIQNDQQEFFETLFLKQTSL